MYFKMNSKNENSICRCMGQRMHVMTRKTAIQKRKINASQQYNQTAKIHEQRIG